MQFLCFRYFFVEFRIVNTVMMSLYLQIIWSIQISCSNKGNPIPKAAEVNQAESQTNRGFRISPLSPSTVAFSFGLRLLSGGTSERHLPEIRLFIPRTVSRVDSLGQSSRFGLRGKIGLFYRQMHLEPCQATTASKEAIDPVKRIWRS